MIDGFDSIDSQSLFQRGFLVLSPGSVVRCRLVAAWPHYAIECVTGKMVSLVRESNNPYKCVTGLADLDAVANGEKKVPREWINERGNMPTQAFDDYARPLIQGEVVVPIKDGLPLYARLKGVLAEKKLPTWQKAGK